MGFAAESEDERIQTIAMIEIEWHPRREKLRGFGDVAMFFFTVFSLIMYLWRGMEASVSLCFCAVGAAIYLASRIWGPLVKPFYVGLMLLTFPIGWIVSNLVLAAVFYLVLTPIGLVFHLFGRDPLERKAGATGNTCWVRRPPPATPKRYFKQF